MRCCFGRCRIPSRNGWLRSGCIHRELESSAIGPHPGQYNDLRKENHSFEEIAISRLTSWTVTSLDRPEQIDGMRTSSNLLRMLGAKPFLGRLLAPEDDRPGKVPVTILSYGA